MLLRSSGRIRLERQELPAALGWCLGCGIGSLLPGVFRDGLLLCCLRSRRLGLLCSRLLGCLLGRSLFRSRLVSCDLFGSRFRGIGGSCRPCVSNAPGF